MLRRRNVRAETVRRAPDGGDRRACLRHTHRFRRPPYGTTPREQGAGTALSGASANAQRRLACPAAQDLDEMGGVRESRASSNLGRGQTIEER
jgi:hypothetical protein